ncbi:ABC transporter ATP-binding protein [Pseudomonadota bacterium]
MPSAIHIDNVHKHYGELHALNGMSLTIEQGEFFGLLGPNGAGKSTLINIIAGLTHMTSGHVSVMGHNVVSDYRHSRECLGVVPQEIVYDPFFTVRELLRIQAGYFGKGKEVEPWIDALLEGLHLSDKANTNMRALSGGMKRRVLIAQALVHKPQVVILDEPTAGVDVELRSSLWEFVQALHHDGHTIVLTTHYLEEAENLCDRIAIINRGELIALDEKEVLLARGVGKTCNVCMVLAQPLQQIPERLQSKIKHIEGNHIELLMHRDKETLVSLIDDVRAAGGDIVDLKTEEADLEDVFIELTKASEGAAQ